MKKFLNNLHTEAQEIRMTHAEKASMRAAIFGTPSSAHSEKSPYVFLSFFSSSEFRMAMAGVVMVLLVGSGTASAAAGALPGDLLYPIKISVTEKVETALAPSAAAKAAVEVSLAERRVEEAQTLAAEGRLNADVAATLAANFDAHADSAVELAEKIEADEPGAAAQIKTKLSSSLAVNGAVLKRIGKGSKDERTKEESQTLGTRVIARAEGPRKVALQARTFAAAAPAAKSADATMAMAMNTESAPADMVTERAAAQMQEKAAEELAEAKELFAQVAPSLDATTTAQLRAQFAVADETMSQGSTLLSSAFGEAQAHFAEVLGMSVKLQALLKAEQRFDNGILRVLLNDNGGEGSSNGENGLEMIR